MQLKQATAHQQSSESTVTLGFISKPGYILLFFHENVTIKNNVPYTLIVSSFKNGLCKQVVADSDVFPFSKYYSFISVLNGYYVRQPAVNMWDFGCQCPKDHMFSFNWKHALGHDIECEKAQLFGIFFKIN